MRTTLAAVSLVSLAVAAAALAAVDPAKLPLGDGKYTTSGPKRGWIYACGTRSGGGGAAVDGPWITGSTWNSREKISVGGSVTWTSTTAFRKMGSTLRIIGNALPKHT